MAVELFPDAGSKTVFRRHLFSARERYGRVSFLDLLKQIANVWENRHDDKFSPQLLIFPIGLSPFQIRNRQRQNFPLSKFLKTLPSNSNKNTIQLTAGFGDAPRNFRDPANRSFCSSLRNTCERSASHQHGSAHLRCHGARRHVSRPAWRWIRALLRSMRNGSCRISRGCSMTMRSW